MNWTAYLVDHLLLSAILGIRLIIPCFVVHFACEKGRRWPGWLILSLLSPELGLYYITLAADLNGRRYFPRPWLKEKDAND
jgi:hypothetical protein